MAFAHLSGWLSPLPPIACLCLVSLIPGQAEYETDAGLGLGSGNESRLMFPNETLNKIEENLIYKIRGL